MPSFSKRVEIEDARCERDTPNAILVSLEHGEQSIWIPQSQIDDDSEVWKEGDEGTLIISEWIAIQKELI